MRDGARARAEEGAAARDAPRRVQSVHAEWEGVAAGGDHAGARVPRVRARALPGEGARARAAGPGGAGGPVAPRGAGAALEGAAPQPDVGGDVVDGGRRVSRALPRGLLAGGRRGRRDAARDGAAPVGRRPVHQPGEGAQRGGRPRRGARRLPPRRAARPELAPRVPRERIAADRRPPRRGARVVRAPRAAARRGGAPGARRRVQPPCGVDPRRLRRGGRPRGGVWRVARPGRGVRRVGRGDRAEPGVHGASRAQLLPGGRLALPPRRRARLRDRRAVARVRGRRHAARRPDGRRRLPRPRVGPRARRAAGGGARRARGEPPPPHADGRLERGRRRAARAGALAPRRRRRRPPGSRGGPRRRRRAAGASPA